MCCLVWYFNISSRRWCWQTCNRSSSLAWHYWIILRRPGALPAVFVATKSRHFSQKVWRYAAVFVPTKLDLIHRKSGHLHLCLFWQNPVFLWRPGDLSSCVCGDKKLMFFTGSRAISNHVCGQRTSCFERDLLNFHPCLWWPKEVLQAKPYLFFLTTTNVFVPKPNLTFLFFLFLSLRQPFLALWFRVFTSLGWVLNSRALWDRRWVGTELGVFCNLSNVVWEWYIIQSATCWLNKP